MCGKAYDPRLTFSNGQAVMGGTCCKSTGSNWSSSPAKGELVDEAGKELFDKIKARYDEQVSPYYAASRLWTDYWSPDTANLISIIEGQPLAYWKEI
jgi:acetyl-CoA carboxylase carboxyltransferase component